MNHIIIPFIIDVPQRAKYVIYPSKQRFGVQTFSFNFNDLNIVDLNIVDLNFFSPCLIYRFGIING